MLFSHLATLPAFKARLMAVIERQLSPFEALPASHVLRCVVGAALRGRWGVIGEILEVGRQALAVNRELRARSELLGETDASVLLARDAA